MLGSSSTAAMIAGVLELMVLLSVEAGLFAVGERSSLEDALLTSLLFLRRLRFLFDII